MADLEGMTLDRYELRRVIGKGGMAEVYEGYDPRFERKVAIKIFIRNDEEMLNRFIREARVMAALRHPHLIPIYDAGKTTLNGALRHYIVMPLMQGGTLRTRLRKGPLSPMEVRQYLRSIASALDYMHQQGIIHRDIKASNVLLDEQGHCYLADFGIARRATDATQLTSTGFVLGTADYIAPELFDDGRKADALSDLYSLAVLLFEMVTGRLPFESENQLVLVTMHMSKEPPSPRTYVPDLPPQTEQVILKGLEKKPEHRYPSAQALVEAFEQSLQPRPAMVAASGIQEINGQRLVLPAPPPVASSAVQPMHVGAPLRATSSHRRLYILLASFLSVLLILGLLIAVVLTSMQQSPTTGTQSPPPTTGRPPTDADKLKEITSGKPAFSDKLNDSDTEWQWDHNNNCTFKHDGYHVTTGRELVNLSFKGCMENAYQFHDATIMVDMTIAQGEKGGIFVRAQKDGFGNFAGYLFLVDVQGAYQLLYSENFSMKSQVLSKGSITQDFKQGGKNTLQIIAEQNKLSLYVNDIFLETIQHDALSEGTIALYARSDQVGVDADVIYRNLRVYTERGR
ncbi:serine/threonine protein kinase [Thermosporothrix hazakensis]|jgi:serine/threonine protein kinase|uniref:non-specific serine/threonine protein kinase n=2 Tax=Thermosporothrix TaxID=768650 RepID=A0A326UA49_THEHA|nr:serine/threonine-protein kinase [Thermosporothrix hazakensis]PZW32961.1 serine/threonine protein kinase [Thermosporothrix hazakensis]BBH90943.1 hypothetical protein KTC_56940 [Thermosporothrix sp. COM3]GCE48993.1 hypothetical protein KTH_38620 [Thermosporothrix hazakensis]